MRRLICFCSVAAAVCLIFAAVLSVSAATYILGDVNNDGTVAIDDVTHIQRITAQMEPETAEAVMRGDVDENGKLEIVDATYIQRYDIRLHTPCKNIGKEFEEPTQAPTQKPTSKPDPYELPIV